MRIEARIEGNLTTLIERQIARAGIAVTAGVTEATDGLKEELREQIVSAGLGERLAKTWRGRVYPEGGVSAGAAGFVWSKAPRIARVYEEGAVIRSTKGLFLAIPTPAAGSTGDGGKKMTPGLWERMHGIRLRFIYRRGVPSLLVADNARINRHGRAVANLGRRDGNTFTRMAGRTSVPMFILVPQVRLRKRLDVAGAARRWIGLLPGRVLQHWND